MKLTIREDSINYAVSVIKLPPKQKVEGLNNLVRVTVFGNDVLTQKDTDETCLYLFFPAGCQIDESYLSLNNEFREGTLNLDKTKNGFFEENGRVKAIKFKGVISTGYIAPLHTLTGWRSQNDWKLKEGDEFTTIDGIDLVKKYVPKITKKQGTAGNGESKHNKRIKKFDRLVPHQFRFHTDTPQLAKCLHLIDPEDVIVITDKCHGTSAVFSNVLVKHELKWYEKLAAWLAKPILGPYLNFNFYGSVYSSRKIVKNQYINKEAGSSYYGEDVWKYHNDVLSINGAIENGITLYGEIVGYTGSGKAIQKGYAYGSKVNQSQLKIYRITYTKPDGSVIEYTWEQIKEYCKKHSLETVPQLYHGKVSSWYDRHKSGGLGSVVNDGVLELMSTVYLEKDCKYNPGQPAEGICVRVDGKSTYSTYKLKSKRFMKHESDELDKGVVSMEDEQGVTEDAGVNNN